jgi:hypothetical protein
VSRFNALIGQPEMNGMNRAYLGTNTALLAQIHQERRSIFNQPHNMGRAALDTHSAAITLKDIYSRYHFVYLLYSMVIFMANNKL